MNIYTILIIAVIIIFIVAIVRFKIMNTRKTEENSYDVIPNIRSKDYKATIYKNTPIEYKESIKYLYDRLEQLESRIEQNNQKLNVQSVKATSDILQCANEAEKEIERYWKYSKKKADFYYYIGLHYASFTLADKLTEELYGLRKLGGVFTDMINSTQSQIDSLSKKINNKSLTNKAQMKRDHQELCKKCDALRKARNTCNEQSKVCMKRRDAQNRITGRRRDYIGNNFGKKGRDWKRRLLARHH